MVLRKALILDQMQAMQQAMGDGGNQDAGGDEESDAGIQGVERGKEFARLGMQLVWQGSGVDEKGIDSATGRTIIKIDPKYFRPAEVDLLLGDPTKAKTQLGWELKTSFEELVNMMTDADFILAEREKRADG